MMDPRRWVKVSCLAVGMCLPCCGDSGGTGPARPTDDCDGETDEELEQIPCDGTLSCVDGELRCGVADGGADSGG